MNRSTGMAVLMAFLAPPVYADVTAAFSPGTAEQTVIDTIRSARHSIHVAAYSFTSRPIAQALIDARAHGVEVAAVLDKCNLTGRYSGATFLAHAGIPVRVDSQYASMHDKFMVIDGVTVETGSFNFTRAAGNGRNAENVIILRDMPDVAAAYEQEFVRLWVESDSFEL